MTDEKRDWVLKELVPKILADNVDYKILDCCEIEAIPLTEAFMLTNCFRMKLFAFRDETKTDRKKFSFFVKVTPKIDDEVLYKAMGFELLFHNEEIGYTDLLPVMGLTINTPKYFKAYKTTDSLSMVIFDFAVDGWRLSKSRVNLSLEHILLAVGMLGNFHGNAYAVKNDTPETFFEMIKNLKEARFQLPETDPLYNKVMSIGVERVGRVARDLVPEEFVNELMAVMDNPYHALKRMAQPKEPMAILCHGDFLRNNMAFQFENETPTAAMMFDFQTLRYSSPMIDLSVFIANSTGKDVRPENFDKIMTIYHTELVKAYHKKSEKQSKLPEHLSYDSIVREFTQYLPYGILIASHFVGELHSPQLTANMNDINPEEMMASVATQGGKVVDDELASLALDCYNLCTKLGLKLTIE